MKANLAAKVFSLALWSEPNGLRLPSTSICSAGLVLLCFAVALIAGCKTRPAVDWNSRVGTYTFDQAVADMGPPNKQTKIAGGKTVDQWITLANNTARVSAYPGGIDAMGAGQPAVQTYKDHVLELTFGPDGKLVSWAKNY